MKKLSSWYAFMRFQESWYSNIANSTGIPVIALARQAQKNCNLALLGVPSSHSRAANISVLNFSLEVLTTTKTTPKTIKHHKKTNITISLTTKSNRSANLLSMQISNFWYAEITFLVCKYVFFKTPHIQIRFLGKDPVFKYDFLVLFSHP